MYQPGLLSLACGRMTPVELYREEASLLEPGINFGVDFVQITGDGKTYAYSLLQQLDELQLVEGLK